MSNKYYTIGIKPHEGWYKSVTKNEWYVLDYFGGGQWCRLKIPIKDIDSQAFLRFRGTKMPYRLKKAVKYARETYKL